MAKVEHPEKHGWWLNELESLGINTREGDPKKTTELTMDIRRHLTKACELRQYFLPLFLDIS
jgi:hypothetical protein